MKYKTKVYLSLFFIASLSSALGVFIQYAKLSDLLKFELRTKVVSVAATASALISPDLVQKVASEMDSTTADFYKLKRQLLEARDNNRRTDLFVRYIYILKPLQNDPRQMVFVAEAQNVVLPGELDSQQEQSQIEYHLDEFYSPMNFIHDQWGTWMSGFSPIIDQSGNYVATLGVDVSALSVEKELNLILRFGLYSFLIALFLAYLVGYFITHRLTGSFAYICELVRKIKENQPTPPITLHDEFGSLASFILEMSQGVEEKEKLKENFKRYVSKGVIDQLLNQNLELNLQGERKRITVLFTDIRHFTQLSEELPPETIVAMLNEYFDAMLPIIFDNQGTLDKFIGDGIMVEFGAPLDDLKQEYHAVKTALAMQEKLKELCHKWKEEDKPTFDVGIGIHTGLAIVGNIGSVKRMEYTAIGDAVNIASRLEQATKHYKISLLISHETLMGLQNQFPYKLVDTIALPGRTGTTAIYAILKKGGS